MNEYVVKWGGIATDVTKIAGRYCYPEFKELIGARRGEEIIRCRDCKHAQPVDTKMANAIVCRMWALNEEDGGEVAPMVEPNGFCSWGERP